MRREPPPFQTPNRRARRAWARGAIRRLVELTLDSVRRRKSREANESEETQGDGTATARLPSRRQASPCADPGAAE